MDAASFENANPDALMQLRQVVNEMYDHGLYVFGGHHTQQSVVGLQTEDVKKYFGNKRPNEWFS